MARDFRNLLVLVVLAGTLLPGRARADDDEESRPIPRFAIDVRAAYAKFQERLDLQALGTVVPSRGLGIDVGVHVYPLRLKIVTFGIGGQFVTCRGGRTPTADEFPGPRLETRFRSLAPQVSFNFGHRQGWSYISGGIAKSTFFIRSGDSPYANGPDVRLKTINYGAGARWFWNDHLAVCVDIRIYAINPNPAVGALVGTPRMNQLVVSSGLSFH